MAKLKSNQGVKNIWCTPKDFSRTPGWGYAYPRLGTSDLKYNIKKVVMSSEYNGNLETNITQNYAGQ
jgi:hypothetical protein